jgi:hypothetical protein
MLYQLSYLGMLSGDEINQSRGLIRALLPAGKRYKS